MDKDNTFSFCQTLSPYANQDNIDDNENLLFRQAVEAVAPRLVDGKAYIVQLLPTQLRPVKVGIFECQQMILTLRFEEQKETNGE